MDPTVTKILELCQTLRCQTTVEKALQDALETLFRENFSTVERELHLGPGDVVDFLLDGSVAVEVKVDGSPMALTRQIQRYAEHKRVEAVVVVTTRAKHRSVPNKLRGKPVAVAWLNPL